MRSAFAFQHFSPTHSRIMKSRSDFRKIADLWQSFEVLVLGPESGLVGEGDGVDQGIGEGELVADEEIGGGDGDFLVDGEDDAGAHGLGDFVGLFQAPLFERHLADLRDDDARDEQGGELEQNRAEMNGVGSGVETFEPTAGIEKIELHVVENEGFSEFAIRLALEFKRCLPLQEPDELLRSEDGAELDVAVLLDDA